MQVHNNVPVVNVQILSNQTGQNEIVAFNIFTIFGWGIIEKN